MSEFFVGQTFNHKRIIYLIKESLKDKTELNVVSGVFSSFNAIKVCEALQRMNYVTISNINTITKVVEGKRRITFTVVISKTNDFDRLYKENEEKRNNFIAEQEKQNKEQK